MFLPYKKAFVSLGSLLKQVKKGLSPKDAKEFQGVFPLMKTLKKSAEDSYRYNPWFDSENVFFALEHWGRVLNEKDMEDWLHHYDLPVTAPKTIAVVMAGNLPLVGFHDFMCVLLSGHYLLVKNSSEDTGLLRLLSEILFALDPNLKNRVQFVEKIEKFDALIVTGSDHTANYFSYRFRNHPALIRKSRTSIALLQGDESHQELCGLGNDLLRYFGRGCRNVSKLLLPRNYPLETLFSGLQAYDKVMENPKYASNYQYYKSIYSLQKATYKENGFLLFKQDKGLYSPLSVVFYEYYDELADVQKNIKSQKNELQCIVASRALYPRCIPFGKTQFPKLTDYADGVDTMDFLEGL